MDGAKPTTPTSAMPVNSAKTAAKAPARVVEAVLEAVFAEDETDDMADPRANVVAASGQSALLACNGLPAHRGFGTRACRPVSGLVSRELTYRCGGSAGLVARF
jgi:hypothetical protein